MERPTLKSLLNIAISPKNGWDKISECNFKKDTPLVSLLLPIAGVAAAVAFAQNITLTAKMVESGLSDAIRLATVAFTKFFATYFIVIYLIPTLLSGVKFDRDKFATYISYLLSIITLYYIVVALLPVAMPYMAVASLYIAYVAYCGTTRYLNITDTRVVNIMVISVSFITILLPAVIDIILKLLLNISRGVM